MELARRRHQQPLLAGVQCPRTSDGLCLTCSPRRGTGSKCCSVIMKDGNPTKVSFSGKPRREVPPRFMWSGRKNVKELDVAEWVSTVVKDPMVEIDPVTMSRHLQKATRTTLPAPSLWTGSYVASRGTEGFLVALGAALTLASLAMAVHLFRSRKQDQLVEYPSSDEENKLDMLSILEGSELVGVLFQEEAVQHSLAVRGNVQASGVYAVQQAGSISTVVSKQLRAEQPSSKPTHGSLVVVPEQTEVLQVAPERAEALQAVSEKTEAVQVVPEKTIAVQAVPDETQALQAVPRKEQSVQAVAKKTQALQAVPEKSEAILQVVPGRPQALQVVPDKAEALQAVSQKEQAVQAVPKKTEAFQAVPEKSEALQVLSEGPKALQFVPQRPEALQVVTEKAEKLQVVPEKPGALQVAPERTVELPKPVRAPPVVSEKSEVLQVSESSPAILPEVPRSPAVLVGFSTGQDSDELSVGISGNHLDDEEKKNQEIRKVVRAAAPAMAIGAGAISFIHGVDGAFEMVGFAATASLVSFELLWADARREFVSQMKGVTDHRKLKDLLQGRKIVQVTEYDAS